MSSCVGGGNSVMIRAGRLLPFDVPPGVLFDGCARVFEPGFAEKLLSWMMFGSGVGGT